MEPSTALEPGFNSQQEKAVNWRMVGGYALGGVAIVGGAVLVVYTVVNNVTIIGIADDVPCYAAASALFTTGFGLLTNTYDYDYNDYDDYIVN